MGLRGTSTNTVQISSNTGAVLAHQIEQNRNMPEFGSVGNKARQLACKPGSVPVCAGDDHSSGTFVTERLTRPTRTAAGNNHCRPYSVLLPVGLAMPPSLPKARCALTAPFQPCLAFQPSAVCFLLRFPWSRLRRTLSGTVFPWSPDFPPAFALRATARQARYMGMPRRSPQGKGGRPSGQLTHEGFVLTARNVNLAQQGGQNRFAFAIPAAINPGGTKMALESLNHDIWTYVHVWGQPVTEDAQTGFEG
jgi:hypothetical protein